MQNERKRKKKKKGVEYIFAESAKVLDKSVRVAIKGERTVTHAKPMRRAEEYWEKLGPGLTTGAADNDPSGIATYSQAGAKFGTQLIWTTLFTFPFMALVQEQAARIGIVSGKGLAANIRHHYSRYTLVGITTILFFANTLNIAADLNAMSAGAQLLIPWIGMETLTIFFALVSLLLQIFTSYARYSKYLKYLTIALLSYVITSLSIHMDWMSVIHNTLIPSISFTKEQIFLLAAIFGTTISPYMFFWQTSQEVEERVLRGETTIKVRKKMVNKGEIHDMRVDVWSGMFFSNFVAFFIFAAAAGVLYTHGIVVTTAADAAQALRPFAGNFAYLLFALGIISTGLLAIPVIGGSTAYAVAESFGWKYGLYKKLKQAYAFYGVIIISMVIGVIANFFHLDPIKGLIYAAVANGLVAPFILFFIVRISRDKKIMGKYKSGILSASFMWATIIIMTLSGVAAITTLFI